MSMFTDRLRNDRNPFDNWDIREQAADKIEKLENALVSQQESAGKLLTDTVAAANKDSKIAADKIEKLEAAARLAIEELGWGEMDQARRRLRAALAPEQDK